MKKLFCLMKKLLCPKIDIVPAVTLIFLIVSTIPSYALERIPAGGVDLNYTDPYGRYDASISADGRYIVFSSHAKLLQEDNNDDYDVYLYDRETKQISLISVGLPGVQSKNKNFSPSISNDGRYVLFFSLFDNRIDKDHPFPPPQGIFLHDRNSNTTTLIWENRTKNYCDSGVISGNGHFVVFSCRVDGKGDIFMKDLVRNTPTIPVCVNNSGDKNNKDCWLESVSADGRYVAFISASDNLVQGDDNVVNDVFVRDINRGTIRRVSVDSLGNESDGGSAASSISADGRYVFFISEATNLVGSPSTARRNPQAISFFVHDLISNETTLVSFLSDNLSNLGYSPSISGNGRYVAFTRGRLGRSDYHQMGAFVGDRLAGNIINVLADLSDDFLQGNVSYSDDSMPVIYDPVISADGKTMIFSSNISNLINGDDNNRSDLFIADVSFPPAPEELRRPELNKVINDLKNPPTIVSPPPPLTSSVPKKTCSDSDGGDYPKIAGSVHYTKNLFSPEIEKRDSCFMGRLMLREHSCSPSGDARSVKYICRCSAGRCTGSAWKIPGWE